MGTFPLSLIALGQIRRRHFDDTLTLRPKKTRNATEELESPQEIEIAARTEQIETTAPGARPYRDHFPFDEATLLRLIAASLPLPLIEYYCNGGFPSGAPIGTRPSKKMCQVSA
jgi:hypothetical protein